MVKNDEKTKFLTKFQKDFDCYLRTFSTIQVDGEINDLQVYVSNQDGDIVNKFDTIENYISDKYGGENRLVIAYDFSKSSEHRFSILNKEEEFKKLFPKEKDREIINKILFTDYNDKEEEDNDKENDEVETDKDIDKDKEKKNNFNYDDFVSNLTYTHTNDGASADIAKMCTLLDLDSDILTIENNTRSPFIFVLTTTSLSALTPGNIGNDGELALYSNLFALEKQLDYNSRTTDIKDKLIILVNKANDVPAWLGSDQMNEFIKNIHVSYPDASLRHDVLSSYFSSYKDDEDSFFAKYKLGGNDDKLISLTAGYGVNLLLKLIDFIKNNKDLVVIDNEPIKIDKLIFLFESGNPDVNPWEDGSIFKKIENFKIEFKKQLKGQDRSLDKIASILSMAATGVNKIQNEHAPQVFLFLAGPTGTGKTETCKILADVIFGSREKMFRFDMSEYSDESSAVKLIGSAPGYVGYEEGGQLTNAARNNPFSLFLFDEIEKAHPSIFDKFLQILSDGRLTDGQGRTVSFENSIIVMTSNEGIKMPTVSPNNPSIINELINDYRKHLINPIYASNDGYLKVENGEKIVFNFDENGNINYKDYLQINENDKKNCRFITNDDEFYSHLSDFVNDNLNFFFTYKLNRKEIFGRLFDSIVCYNYICKDAAKEIIDNNIDKYEKYFKDKYYIFIDNDLNDVKKHLYEIINQSENRSLGGRGIIKEVNINFVRKITSYISTHQEEIIKNKNEKKQNYIQFIFDDNNVKVEKMEK